jgi:hypothetical protein
VDYGSGKSSDPAYEYPYPDTDASPEIRNAVWPSKTKRFRFGALGGFIAAVLLIAAGVGAYFGITALTTKDNEQPFTINGTLSLRADSITTSGLPTGFACAGKGGYNDIGPGTAVTVANESGTLLAKGILDSSFGEKNWCVFTFNITDVPAGAKFYKVSVSRRGEMSYTEQEARGRIELNLGDSSPEATTGAPPPAPAPPPAAAPAPAPAPGPVPADPTVPTYATQCISGVAVGSSKTSCAFAANVLNAYWTQPQRSGTVFVYAYSPITDQSYLMTCTGQRVVTCSGGDNAIVYLY